MDELLTTQVAAARAGDREAIENLIRRVGRITLPLATSVLGDRQIAGDVAQDVAVDVLRGLAKLRDPERFDAWVRRIAVRRSLRAARIRRHRWSAEVALEVVPDSALASEAESTAETLAVRDSLRSALAALTARQRLALVLRYVHGLSDAEIAAALDCRPGTVASLVSRARSTLLQDDALTDLATSPNAGGLR